MASNRMLRGSVDWEADVLGAQSSATNGLTIGRCNYVLGTGTNTVTAPAVAGGVIRLTGDTNEAADVLLTGPRAYQINRCGLVTLRARVRLNTSLTGGAFSIGMQDIVTTGQISYENGSVVSTPADGFVLLYEQEQSASQYYTLGVGNDVDDTARITTNADTLVLATFVTVLIEADSTNGSNGNDTGVVRYRVHVDGKLLTTATTDARGFTTSACRSTVVLAPVIGRYGRATANTLDVAEFRCNGMIGTALD